MKISSLLLKIADVFEVLAKENWEHEYHGKYNETFEEKVTKNGIIWLKSSKHKADPKGNKIQGKGWEVVMPERTQEENLEIFKMVKRLFDIENPQDAPTFTEFKTTVKRDLES